jgi:predicted Zn-dependent protease
MDKAVGGDPYLHLVRGNILMEADRLDEAAKEAQEASAAGPDFAAETACHLAPAAPTHPEVQPA